MANLDLNGAVYLFEIGIPIHEDILKLSEKGKDGEQLSKYFFDILKSAIDNIDIDMLVQLRETINVYLNLNEREMNIYRSEECLKLITKLYQKEKNWRRLARSLMLQLNCSLEGGIVHKNIEAIVNVEQSLHSAVALWVEYNPSQEF